MSLSLLFKSALFDVTDIVRMTFSRCCCMIKPPTISLALFGTVACCVQVLETCFLCETLFLSLLVMP